MLSTLFERVAPDARLPLPPALVERYGGALGFPEHADRPHVIANFVTTLDGVISFALPGRAHASLISGANEADRFVLGLLRACADVVVVGAGTVRAEGDHLWTPEHVYPAAAAEFAALRASLRKSRRPTMVFVTASGALDLNAPAFSTGDRVVVLTTAAGAARLRPSDRVEARALRSIDARAILAEVVALTGARLVLTEGGPRLLGAFFRDRALDELFLTLAPQVGGRSDEQRRPALVEGAAFAPEDAPWASLVSAKRADDFLFLRFRLPT